MLQYKRRPWRWATTCNTSLCDIFSMGACPTSGANYLPGGIIWPMCHERDTHQGHIIQPSGEHGMPQGIMRLHSGNCHRMIVALSASTTWAARCQEGGCKELAGSPQRPVPRSEHRRQSPESSGSSVITIIIDSMVKGRLVWPQYALLCSPSPWTS